MSHTLNAKSIMYLCKVQFKAKEADEDWCDLAKAIEDAGEIFEHDNLS